YRKMSIDEEWAVREDRGFTWWGHWVRQRVWADTAVESHGDTLWHVRARTPIYRDLPDTADTYALLQDLNGITSLSAYVYDPDDRSISSRCGVFVYDEIAQWIDKYLLASVGLQASFGWSQGQALAEGHLLDDAAHPAAGHPEEPDEMLSVAGSWAAEPCAITRPRLNSVAATLSSEGAGVMPPGEDGAMKVVVPLDDKQFAVWAISATDHPFLGPGAGTRLVLPFELGPQRGAWLANALNLAETSEWRGEDRPHALGAWQMTERMLVHDTFVPASILGALSDDGVMLVVRNFLAWGSMRAKAAGERMPWLMAAAQDRYPDDEPVGSAQTEQAEEPFVPYEERSFGPASRTRRPRPATPPPHAPVVRLVDPREPDAYAEIDAAVEAADDGDTVIVRPGTYRTPVVVDRAVEIRGEGPREEIVLEPIGGEAIGFAASGATASGLTIRPALAGNDGALHSAVAVHNVQVAIRDCDLSSHLGATVWIGGPTSRALIEGCAMHDGAQNAVFVAEEGRAEVISCRVAGHRWSLVAGGPGAVLLVRDSDILDNYEHGIAAMGGATLGVESCRLLRNASNGVWLAGAGPASSVVDSTIEGNGGTGVFVEDSTCRVAGNRVADNGVGLVVTGVSAATLEGNTLVGNAIGLGVRGSDAAPKVIGNTIERSRRDGIALDQGAAGQFESNAISESGRAGVWVSDERTRPVFVGNHVRGGAIGVLVAKGSGGEFRSNDLRGNRNGSWQIEGPADLVREDNLEDAERTPGGSLGPSGRSAPQDLMN
ncbi:MAG: right-handed parallel beta-helix repeat-containing protein, partial [Chloroflexota bacterium]